jgi:ribosomal-protein-alanine acetyltransferase
MWFGLRGVDPEAVVVTFATGPRHLAEAMHEEVKRLIPDRRHFFVESGSTWELWRKFRGFRIGMAPMLIGTGPEFSALRRAAWLLTPRKILAFNPRLERYHLALGSPISSLLFACGVPLDRIHLRPWFWPWKTDRTTIAPSHRRIEGRAASPARARAAVVTPFFPWPLAHGGAVRIYNLLREASCEYDIDLYAFVENESAADIAEVARFCHRLFLLPKPRYREPRWSTLLPPEVHEYWSPELAHLLSLHRAPVTQIEYAQLALYPGDILVEHDVTWDLYRQIYDRTPTTSNWWNWWRWQRCERGAIRRAGAVVAMSDKDAGFAQHQHAVVIANGVDLVRFKSTPDPAASRRLLFIGSLRHFPNASALRFFLDEVWPRLKGVELTVVAGPDPERHWQGPLPTLDRVRILGYVADVRPLYDETNVVIVPTLVSAGTNIKVLEAMAMERPVVSTSSGCAGLGLVHGESVWVADDAEAFAGGIRRLIGDAVLRRRLATAARTHAERNFSWHELGRKQRELWREWAPSPVRQRTGAEADLPEIERIQAASPQAAQWPPREYLARQLTVADLHGTVVGFAVTRTIAPDEHELLNLAVDPAHRGHGIGRRLLEAALGNAPGTVHLEVRESNTTAIRFYEKLGFYIVGLRNSYYQTPDESGIVMSVQK